MNFPRIPVSGEALIDMLRPIGPSATEAVTVFGMSVRVIMVKELKKSVVRSISAVIIYR